MAQARLCFGDLCEAMGYENGTLTVTDDTTETVISFDDITDDEWQVIANDIYGIIYQNIVFLDDDIDELEAYKTLNNDDGEHDYDDDSIGDYYTVDYRYGWDDEMELRSEAQWERDNLS
jgi:hypothetical protein